MERMEAKGWLVHRVDGRTYLYSASVPRQTSVGQKVQEIVDKLCDGRPEQLVTALLDYRGLNSTELRKIQKLLEDARRNRERKVSYVDSRISGRYGPRRSRRIHRRDDRCKVVRERCGHKGRNAVATICLSLCAPLVVMTVDLLGISIPFPFRQSISNTPPIPAETSRPPVAMNSDGFDLDAASDTRGPIEQSRKSFLRPLMRRCNGQHPGGG